MARDYEGNVEGPGGLLLKPGERVFASITGASLIEERSGGGSWQGRSSGLSVPIGLGIRYRVGASRGHYVKAPPVPTAIDQGLFVVTNQRAGFQGTRQTRDCPFNRLLGFSYAPDNGGITIAVSNRQKPTTVRFGPDLGSWFSFRFELALARFRGTHAQLVRVLEAQLADLQAKQPVPPVTEPQVIPPAQNQPALPAENGANDAYSGWVGDWAKAYFAWVAEQGIELDPEIPRADFEQTMLQMLEQPFKDKGLTITPEKRSELLEGIRQTWRRATPELIQAIEAEKRSRGAEPMVHVSPDGKWYWDGAQWVPTSDGSPQP